jgi:hypothetical protein
MGPPRHFRTPLQLVWGSGLLCEEGGKLQLSLNVLASRQRDNGIELLGGVCQSAKALQCEFVIDAFEDVLLRRELDRGTGLHPLSDAFGARAPAPAAASGEAAPSTTPATSDGTPAPAVAFSGQSSAPPSNKQSWADAVMASVRAETDPEEGPPAGEEEEGEDYRPVRPGDLLDHQQFGRCIVQRVDADGDFVTVRLRNSRLVRLSLEVLRLRYQGEEEGHQVFATNSAASSEG